MFVIMLKNTLFLKRFVDNILHLKVDFVYKIWMVYEHLQNPSKMKWRIDFVQNVHKRSKYNVYLPFDTNYSVHITFHVHVCTVTQRFVCILNPLWWFIIENKRTNWYQTYTRINPKCIAIRSSCTLPISIHRKKGCRKEQAQSQFARFPWEF